MQNLLGLSENDFENMRQVEEDIYSKSMEYFKEKTKRFNKIIKNRSLRDTILKLEEKYEKENNNKNVEWRLTDKVSAEEYLKDIFH